MSAKFDRLVKGFSDAIRTPKTKTTPYDTVATVTRTDGDTVYVHIPGGVDETPVSKTMDCKSGDKVQVRVSGGRAWVTGNATAPPTDDKKANQALTEVNEVEQNVTILNNVVTENIEATNARFGYVEADTAKIHSLTADQLSATVGYIDDLTAGNITASDIVADHGTIDNLDANYAHISNGFIDNADIKEANVENLTSKYAHITQGVIDNARIGYADVNGLNAHYAEIDMANVNNAWIENGVVKDAAISDAQIIGVSANKLTAGTIDANNINVANLRAKNLIVEKMNGQPILGGYELVNKNSTGYSGKNPSNEGWYEYSNGTFVASTDTTVNMSKAYYKDGSSVALYDQTYIDGLENNLQQQIDGAIETFTGSVVPTLVNYPAVDWTSAQMANHVGDIYYVVNAGNDYDGYSYRFAYNNSTSTYSWVLIRDSGVTAALADISDLQTFQSNTESWITETDDGLETIRTNHTSLSGVVNKTVKSSTQLWFTKANTTAPTAPTSEVTSDSTSGNAWRRVVPTYNASYPYYFYCWQYKYVDNTFGWSAVIYDQATTEAEERARTGVANAATADGKAVSAQNTANANIKSSVQLWFTKANTTAPSKPTSQVTNNSATGSNSYNKWNLVVPVYNSSYPYYYYCYQQQKGDGTYQWSDVVYDQATSEAMKKAQEALPASTFTTFESTTFKNVKDTVDEQSTTINNMSTRIDTKADSSTVTTLSNTVNSVSQTATSNSSKLSQLTTTLGTNADGTTKTNDIMHRMSASEQDLSGFKTTVSQTYTTKEEFNNLEIGGRNLLTNLNSNWHLSSLTNGEYSSSGNQFAPIYTSEGLQYAIPVDAESQYIVKAKTLTVGQNIYVGVQQLNSSKVYFSDSGWKKCSDDGYSFTTANNCAYLRVTFKTEEYTSSTSQQAIDNLGTSLFIKLEKGNKATDWSPCPDDYSTTVQMNSAIQQKANEITLEVSEAYTTKEEFDGLDIGGRNLLTNINSFWHLTTLNNGTYTSSGSQFAPINTVDGLNYVITVDSSADYIVKAKTNVPSQNIYIGVQQLDGSKSFLYDSGWQNCSSDYYGFATRDDCEYIRVTFKTEESTSATSQQAIENLGTSLFIKLEKGNKATDWSPAPEDLESYADNAVTSFASRFSVTPEAISSEVQSTQNGATLVSRINQTASNVKIEAEHIEIDGTAIFNNSDFQTALDAEGYQTASQVSTAISNTSVSDLSDGSTYAKKSDALGAVTTKDQYYLSTSSSSATGGSWQDTVPTWSANKYIWTRVATTKTPVSGSASTTYSTAVYDSALTSALSTASSAQSSANSAASTVVTTKQYYLSTSTSSATGGSWQDSVPTWASGKYIWVRFKIVKTPVSGTASTTYSPSENGVYDSTVTTALSTAYTANAGLTDKADKTAAVAETQRIYYRSSSSTKPNGNGLPTAWVTDTVDKYNSNATTSTTSTTGWTRKVTPISNGTGSSVTKYLYLWTCIQKKTVSGTVTYGDILLDDSTTVIDGGKIITGSVSANSIDATSGTFATANIPDLNASKITAGTISVSRIPDDALNSNISIGGRNLLTNLSDNWKLTTLNNGSYASGGSQFAPINTSSGLEYAIPVDSSTPYVLSAKTLVSGQEIYVGIHQLNSSKAFLNDSGWQKCSDPDYYFTTGSTCSYLRVTFKTGESTAATSQQAINNLGTQLFIQLEKGNKVTDWTPNPEDIQTEIEAKKSSHTLTASNTAGLSYETLLGYSTEGRVVNWNVTSTAGVKVGDAIRLAYKANNMGSNGTIVYLLGTVSSVNSSTNLDAVSHGLDTTVIDGGHILTGTIDANKVNISNLTVGSAQSGWGDVLNSNIDIGGRNHVIKDPHYVNYASIIFESTNKIQYTTTTGSGNSWMVFRSDIEAGTYTLNYQNTSGRYRLLLSVIPSGESGWGSASTVAAGFETANGYWKDVTIPYTFTSSSTFRIGLVFDMSNNKTGTISNLKLEKGNKPTDWSPAPEDIDVNKYVTEIDSNGIWVTPSGKKPTNTATGAGATGAKIDGTNGFGIWNNGVNVAQYGSSARIGSETSGHVNVDADGMDVYDNTGAIANFERDTDSLGSFGIARLKHSAYDTKTSLSPGKLTIDLYGDDTVAQQHAFPGNGVYKTSIDYHGIIYNDNLNPVGSFYEGTNTKDGNSISCTASSWQRVDHLQLWRGIWLITFGGAFASNSSGMRYFVLNTSTSSSVSATRDDIRVAPANGGQTSVHATRIVNITSESTVFYLWVYQNSGTSLSVFPSLRAIRMI